MNGIHYNPADGWLGDPMPMWHDGVWHIYYTKGGPESAGPWGHISTPDFLHYTEHPDPFPTEGDGMPVNTGCVCFGCGKFHAFFSGQDALGPFMYHSVSEDGIRFPRAAEPAFRYDPERYADDTWRDPVVVYDPASRLWRMFFCAKRAQRTGDCFDGGVGCASSPDLYHWNLDDLLPLSGVGRFLECPDVFFENDWNLLYYWHETRFRHAEKLNGEWKRYPVISPDRFNFMAARQAFDGNRRILFGFVQRKTESGDFLWGGNLPVPRELTMGENGPETRFIRELDQLFSRTVRCEVTPTDGKWRIGEDSLECVSPSGGSMIRFSEMPERFLIRFRMELPDPTAVFTLLLGGIPSEETDLDKGYQVIFDVPDRIIRVRRHYLWDQRGDIDSVPLPLNRNHEIAILYDAKADGGAILELELDGKQTLVSRLNEGKPGIMAMSMQDGTVRLTDFSVCREA